MKKTETTACLKHVKLGVSSCLLGEEVRFDGQHKLDRYLRDCLGSFVEWMPVCPEVESGMPVPREAMSLNGNKDSPELLTIRTGKNLTGMMKSWIDKRLPELEAENLSGFIFKKKSPSSALYDAKVHDQTGFPYAKSPGLFAKAFTEKFPLIPVEDEGRLHDPGLRENFIERVFVYFRWQEMLGLGNSKNRLSEFQRRHKLIIMAHCPSKTSVLGKMAAESDSALVQEEYIKILMMELKKQATVKKHVNVLEHILGYFKKDLSAWEKEEILNIIEHYHKQLVPLIVPLTLLKHFIAKYNKEYLKDQHYIYQHPAELKLRNHA